jgi:hypothetical protein
MFKTVVIHSRSTYWTNPGYGEEMTVDSDDLSKELQVQCNQLETEGFDIVTILPINSGNIVNGTGYYHTESIIITAKKR